MPKLRIDHCKINLKIKLRLLQFNYSNSQIEKHCRAIDFAYD